MENQKVRAAGTRCLLRRAVCVAHAKLQFSLIIALLEFDDYHNADILLEIMSPLMPAQSHQMSFALNTYLSHKMEPYAYYYNPFSSMRALPCGGSLHILVPTMTARAPVPMRRS